MSEKNQEKKDFSQQQSGYTDEAQEGIAALILIVIFVIGMSFLCEMA